MAELMPASSDGTDVGTNNDADGEQDNRMCDTRPMNGTELHHRGCDVHDHIQPVEFEGQMVYVIPA